MKYLLALLFLTSCTTSPTTKVADQPKIYYYDNINVLPCTSGSLNASCTTMIASNK